MSQGAGLMGTLTKPNVKPEVRIVMVENGYLVQRCTFPGGTLVAGNLDEAMRLARIQFEELPETPESK